MPACEVSWKCPDHPNRLWECKRTAEYVATGIGNEGSTVFRVCHIHADVVRPMQNLWKVEPLYAGNSSRTAEAV